MADRTLTINHADGDSETYTINRDKFAGVREMSIDGSTVTVDHTATPKAQSKETTFGGSKSITIKRDIEPLLSKVVGGASAAYSLRDLNDKANTSKVVRVRRESDNNERDFNAKEVSNGTLQNWTNAQVTPPLDLRELTATGRDGPIIEAAAAYSLRNLSDSYTGDVVEVRRSSDNAVRSFTAAEVADGTLEAWVNEDVVKYSSDFSSSLDEFYVDSGDTALAGQTFEGESDVIKHTPSDSLSSSHGIRRLSTIPSSRIVSLKALVYIPSSNTVANGAQIRSASGELVAGTITTDEWVEVEATGTSGSGGSSNTLSIRATSGGSRNFTGNGTDAIYYKNVSVTVTAADGTVSKWYDQSTTSGVPNAKHAVQTSAASQPKIVNGGTLVTGGIDFDGVDDELVVSGNPVITANSAGTYSAFSVQKILTSNRGYLYGNASVTDGSSLYASDEDIFGLSNKNEAFNYDIIARDGNKSLLSAVYNNGDAGLLVNGSGTMTDVGTYNFDAGSGDFIIGNRNGGTTTGTLLEGTIQEIIIYNSDQSDNRTALEANIGEVYSIAGIPAYEDTVNGFVETWYDQSGNGNDASQLTAGSQPKIVNAGALVSGGLSFDGINDRLSFASSVALSSNDFFVTSVLSISDGDIDSVCVVGHPVGNRFLLAVDYDQSRVQTRADDGTFLTEPFTVEAPTGNILLTAQRVGDTYNVFHQGTSRAAFNVTGKSFTLGNLGQYLPSAYSKHFLNEIIIYPSDQSANRPAIEANINNQYDI